MNIFKANYTIDVDKGIDDTKQLFEKYFQNMQKKGYSHSVVILNPDYGRKSFTGVVDSNGTYKARLISSRESDIIYRGVPISNINFINNGFDAKTEVKQKAKWAVS